MKMAHIYEIQNHQWRTEDGFKHLIINQSTAGVELKTKKKKEPERWILIVFISGCVMVKGILQSLIKESPSRTRQRPRKTLKGGSTNQIADMHWKRSDTEMVECKKQMLICLMGQWMFVLTRKVKERHILTENTFEGSELSITLSWEKWHFAYFILNL